jgi:hypothetical protein
MIVTIFDFDDDRRHPYEYALDAHDGECKQTQFFFNNFFICGQINFISAWLIDLV